MKIPRGDKGYYLLFTVKERVDDAWVAYNLTDYTITLKVWVQGSSDALLVEAACDILVAASGTCRYLVVDGDFDTAGVFVAELELTKTGAQESTTVFPIEVTESG